MRVAIIDLGTNSVRFDVHAISPQGNSRLLHREKLMIRLGQGVFIKGRMDAQAIERANEVFLHFRAVADSLRVKRIVAFGTSALREAQNSSELIEKVRTNSEIDIKVISGTEEAKLIALGILSKQKMPKGKFALVDIGGGSTEISVGQGKRMHFSQSFPLGTARLQQVFLKRSPPKDASVNQMREYIATMLKASGLTKATTVVGSSGTVKSLCKILDQKGCSADDVSELIDLMKGMNTSELLDIHGMEPKRVDMILAGTILLEEIMKHLGAKKLVQSDFSLRDGILEEEKRLVKSHRMSRMELHLEDLFSRAHRLGVEREHAAVMVELASNLFNRLKRLHKLDDKWKIYLLSTVILRKCGEIVAFGDREKHAYYIVKNSDFSAIDGWEQEFIARLCLQHSGGASAKETTFPGKDKERQYAFSRLLALVRVVDALDIGPRTDVKLRKVTFKGPVVTLMVSGSGAAGIEQLMVDRKKKLFEEVFSRELWVKRTR